LEPPYYFGTNRVFGFKFGTDIEDGPFRRADHKMTHKWAWAGTRVALKGRIAYLPADVTSKVNDMFINKNKTANIKGKRFTTTCKVHYTDVTQLKLQK